jgi:hypothetical protein
MHLKFKILSLLILFSVSSVFAQSNSEWRPIGLTVSGKNVQNGVEAFYLLTKCNNENLVFIKLINHNAFAVTVNWYDAIFTKNTKWCRNQKADIRKSITIGANEVLNGDCSGNIHGELVVNALDFIKEIDDFLLFGIISLKVTNINN